MHQIMLPRTDGRRSNAWTRAMSCTQFSTHQKVWSGWSSRKSENRRGQAGTCRRVPAAHRVRLLLGMRAPQPRADATRRKRRCVWGQSNTKSLEVGCLRKSPQWICLLQEPKEPQQWAARASCAESAEWPSLFCWEEAVEDGDTRQFALQPQKGSSWGGKKREQQAWSSLSRFLFPRRWMTGGWGWCSRSDGRKACGWADAEGVIDRYDDLQELTIESWHELVTLHLAGGGEDASETGSNGPLEEMGS